MWGPEGREDLIPGSLDLESFLTPLVRVSIRLSTCLWLQEGVQQSGLQWVTRSELTQRITPEFNSAIWNRL